MLRCAHQSDLVMLHAGARVVILAAHLPVLLHILFQIVLTSCRMRSAAYGQQKGGMSQAVQRSRQGAFAQIITLVPRVPSHVTLQFGGVLSDDS